MNIPRKTLVIGDIHGELNKLRDVLELSGFDNDVDRLISIGDLCDRGPDSYGVVEELMKIRDLVHCRGNHDQWFMDYMMCSERREIDLRKCMMWIQQGGQETLNSYADKDFHDADRHLAFYDKSVFYYIQDNKCFVHGGFNRNLSIAEQDGMSLIWDRELVNQMMSCNKHTKLKMVDNFDKVFIGHTPTLGWQMDVPGVGKRQCTVPIDKGGVINIDTGVCYFGKLTIMDIDTYEFWQSA